jgi:hypothetical protein
VSLASPEAPAVFLTRQDVRATAAPTESCTKASDRWWQMPDAWITPAVAVTVIALVVTVLVLSALA